MLGPGDMMDKPSENLQMIMEYVNRQPEREHKKLNSSGGSEEDSLKKGGEGWARAFWAEKIAFTKALR